MKNRVLPLIVLVVATTFCLILPSVATAGEYTHPVCWVGAPDGDIYALGFNQVGTGPFQLDAHCPDLATEIWMHAKDGDHSSNAYGLGANLTKLAVTTSGGPESDSGLIITMRVCSFDECGRAITPSPSGLPTDQELDLNDGIPADAVTLIIEESCVKPGGCDVSSNAIFTNLTLTYEDVTPPTAVIKNDWGEPYGPSDTFRLNPGTSDSVGDYIYVDPADYESGVSNIWWTIDNGPIHDDNCWEVPDGVIPTDCGFFSMILPPNFEGVKLFTVYVEDLAGNVGSTSTNISMDTIVPAAPEGLAVGANDAGWINEYEFTAHWSNPNQPAGSDGDPGITKANYRISDSHGNEVSHGSTDGADIDSLPLLVSSSGKYTLSVSVEDAAGNVSEPSSVDFQFDWIPPSPPNIGSIPVVNAQYVDTGLTISWSDSKYWDTSFSGVCSYRYAINSIPHYEPVAGSDVTTVPDTTLSIEISPEQLAAVPDGVRYFHVAGTSCASTDGRASDAAIVIDRKAPRVTPDPTSGGWLAPGTPLILRADDSDPGNTYAGVNTITYAIDGGAAHVVAGPKVSVVLPQGMHSVTYRSTDLSGNVSDQDVMQVGIDDEAPLAAFGANDPSDPALINARVSDADSGVGDAWLEYRSPGSPTWARLVGTSDDESPRALQARFPDDDSLPSGEYQLRIIARDRAGNVSMTTSRVDGSQASVTLPLRPHPRITLEVARGLKAKPTSLLTVPFGATVIARGVLRDPDGAPLSGAAVAVGESISGGQRRQIGVVTTDSTGSYSAEVLGGASRALFADFRGNSLLGSASASATFNVRAGVSLKRLPKSQPSGRYFYLRGRVDPGPVSLPKGGARVLIQHRSGSKWSGNFSEGKTASDGSFEIRTKLNTHGRSVRMMFRAMVEAEGGWPYANGFSQTRKVVIR